MAQAALAARLAGFLPDQGLRLGSLFDTPLCARAAHRARHAPRAVSKRSGTRARAPALLQAGAGATANAPGTDLQPTLATDCLHPTTLEKFYQATEINDLYDDSPLEDQLWAVLKRFGIQAERQEFLTIGTAHYALDFAVYCHKGQIDVETDGDTWHANPEKAKSDNLRDNALEAAGWHVLRFTTQQVRETAESYCIQKVAKTINRLGGIDSGRLVPRPIDLDPGSAYQPSLFDDL